MPQQEKVTEVESLKLNLLTERGRRLEAEAMTLKMSFVRLEQERAALQSEQQAFSEGLKKTYDLKNGDSIQGDGTVVRAPVAQPPAGPLPAPILKAVPEEKTP